MMFAHLYGNERIKKTLAYRIESHQLGHSLLFSGPDGVGKQLFAQVIAEKWVGEKGRHPDIHIYRPQSKAGLYSIEAMRALSEEVFLRPFSAKRKAFLLLEADRMLPTSANALLKTFEEPPDDTLILLVSSRPMFILPTILSRCQQVRFSPLPDSAMRKLLGETEEVERILPLAKGSLSRGKKLLSQESHQWQERLSHLLSQESVGLYKKFQEELDAITSPITLEREHREKELTKIFEEEQTDLLSAKQRESLEKDVQGFVAVEEKESVFLIVEWIYFWYRSLYRLSLSSEEIEPFFSSEEIEPFFSSQEESFRQILRRGPTLSMESLHILLKEVFLSLDRNTSFRVVLETFFLRYYAESAVAV